MGFFHQYVLLVWKGGLLRRRHFIVTAIEIIIPLFLMSLFVYLRSIGGAIDGGREDVSRPTDTKSTRHEPTPYLPFTPYDGYYMNGLNLLYSPDTIVAQTIVNATVEKLINESRRYHDKPAKLIGLKTPEELSAYYLRAQIEGKYDTYAGIVFENLDPDHASTILPDDLKYTLRLSGYFSTKQKFEMSNNFGPRYFHDSYQSGFLAFQAGIDHIFTKLKYTELNSADLPWIAKIYLQRYSYPSYIESTDPLTFLNLIPYVVVYGLSIMMAVFVKRIIDEKVNRSKELMTMMGLSDVVYFLGTFSNAYLLLVIVAVIMTIAFKVRLAAGVAVIFFGDGFLFFVTLLLYMVNAVVFCMALSVFFNKPVLGAIVTYFVWGVTHSVPTMVLDPLGMPGKYAQLTLSAKLATCLLPNCAFHWAVRIMSFFEFSKIGASWSNINQPGLADDNFTLSMVLGMMVVSTCIYTFIYWYVDKVWPWQVGIPKNPLFLFQRSYWFPRVVEAINLRAKNTLPVNKKHFEDPPNGTPGVILDNLAKKFGMGSSKKWAVNGVSLSMLKGHITVLLGHNGAGKTTVMNMLTGMFTPTSGTAMINGFDIQEHTRQARRSLGLCPQHNVLYDSLTVEEHLKFFAGLKGLPFSAMPAELNKTLNLLDLQAKRTTLSNALSGGMKRKLSLGIALIADSEVLVLDEPTAGMDPQARRVIWDMLQSTRHDRTILLTTHYMEEADILGDRIAIMSHGKVECCGSPLFLKKAFGAGYHLRVTKGENFDMNGIKTIIGRNITDMYLDTDTKAEARFVLPTQNTDAFIPLFNELEADKGKLDYQSCGITITTMEDVFLKVGQLSEKLNDPIEAQLAAERNELSSTAGINTGEPLRGMALFLQQCRGLLVKRLHHAKRYKAFLIFQILVPVINMIIMLLIIQLIKGAVDMSNPPLKLNVNEVFGPTEGYFNIAEGDFKSTYERTLANYGANPSFTSDPVNHVLEIAEHDLQRFRNKILVGGLVNSTLSNEFDLYAIFNGEPLHTSPMSLNVMNTAWLRHATGKPDASITITNNPFPQTWYIQTMDGMDLPIRILFSVFFPNALSFLSASFVLFPTHERNTKSKLIQRMTGLSGFTFWLCHFLWDFLMHVVASALLLIPFAAIVPSIYSNADGIMGDMFFLLILYGWSSIPLSYIFSFFTKKPSTGFILKSSVSSITGLMMTMAVGLYKVLAKGPVYNATPEKLAWLFRLFPDFAVTWGVLNLHLIGEKNSYCTSIDPMVLDKVCEIWTDGSNITHPYRQCCKADACGDVCFKRVPYFSWSEDSCGRDLLMLAFSGYIFFAILILVELNIAKLWYKIKKSMKSSQTPHDHVNLINVGHSNQMVAFVEDDDVANERSRIEDLFNRNMTSTEALVTLDLGKQFGNLTAVDNLTFSVHQHECFGLLGVNGAGKTTTFSMLTGDLVIGNGNAYIGYTNVKDNLQQFQNYIGYCPQFDALLDRVTGREALYMFARLRGVEESRISEAVKNMIEMIDLTEHADKVSDKYSGGNRRKLSLGLALIGGPAVILLDEPTAGIDPAARRRIWKALLHVQKHGSSSFILTTHSMEECEALCGRLAIMVNGQFRCLGAIQHLKSKFGQGYTIIMKMQKPPEGVTQTQIDLAVAAIREHMENAFFNLTLKDFHEGNLHYHLMDTSITWSQLFQEMEKVKKIFFLEDYLVSDTTLEQIFLAFARTQRVVIS